MVKWRTCGVFYKNSIPYIVVIHNMQKNMQKGVDITTMGEYNVAYGHWSHNV